MSIIESAINMVVWFGLTGVAVAVLLVIAAARIIWKEYS